MPAASTEDADCSFNLLSQGVEKREEESKKISGS
jgi:hypothetical protein